MQQHTWLALSLMVAVVTELFFIRWFYRSDSRKILYRAGDVNSQVLVEFEDV
jgi:hypothetical protein